MAPVQLEPPRVSLVHFQAEHAQTGIGREGAYPLDGAMVRTPIKKQIRGLDTVTIAPSNYTYNKSGRGIEPKRAHLMTNLSIIIYNIMNKSYPVHHCKPG